LLFAEKLPKSKKAEQYIHAIGDFISDWETVDNQQEKETLFPKMGGNV